MQVALVELEPPRQRFDNVELAAVLSSSHASLAPVAVEPCPDNTVQLGLSEHRTEFCVACRSYDFFDTAARSCKPCSPLEAGDCPRGEYLVPCSAFEDAHCKVCEECDRCGDGRVSLLEHCDTALHLGAEVPA